MLQFLFCFSDLCEDISKLKASYPESSGEYLSCEYE